jgi:hypothetical protein
VFVTGRLVNGGFSTGRLITVASGLVVTVGAAGGAAEGTGGGSVGFRSQPTRRTAANISMGIFMDLI